MIHRLTIDRFEGDKKATAVLVDDDGHQVDFPAGLLPEGAKAGDILSIALAIDHQATADVAKKTKAVQADLKKTDPGGDIKL